MSPKLNEFVVVLQRDGAKTPWGIRLVGGSDLDTPLIITKVTLGSPAYGELVRGDIITKIQDYDSRDLRHEDAQHLFKNAGNKIKVVVQRNNLVAGQTLSNGSSRCSSTIPLSPLQLSPIPPHSNLPYRNVSPAGARHQSPYESLPQTVFPHVNESGGYEAPQLSPRPPSSTSFSPQPTRDYQLEAQEEASVILNQPYRTTPLILPGAKVKRDTGPTESYLRHHPNPAMRAPPHHDFQDALMKQKVVHKQFNSPIGLYSENNIEKTIQQSAPNSVPSNGYIVDRPKPTKIQGYKRTVLYDPLKSETYRAIQEETYDVGNPHEVPQPVQTKVFHPTSRGVPQKKPVAVYPPVSPNNAMDPNDIHQSGSFKRLMYSVLGDTSY
ncbi:LIM domain-binding protein 3 isoform X3 [Phlebotomus papatasi]|uniref:LIM domain-binding protein 3 isoform X3 n=1 Tax=Phlebotomus papatasi TaxID=29031 RepID=UPI0024835F15|nr:LIM domain-binding protein 3 isoform X3 [Phlebotomus papatasi]